MSEPTEAQIEAERRVIIKKTVDAMIAENVVIAHPTVAARLEKDYPGFEYRPKLDNFRAVLDQNIPPQPAPVVGALAAIEPTDTAAPVEAEPEPMDLEQFRAHIHRPGKMSRAELRSQLVHCRGCPWSSPCEPRNGAGGIHQQAARHDTAPTRAILLRSRRSGATSREGQGPR